MRTLLMLWCCMMFAGDLQAVNLNEVCENESACESDNAVCKRSLIGCSKSTCACKEGFRKTSPTSCSEIKEHLQACVSGTDVCRDINMQCLLGICRCISGYKYDMYIKKCIPTSTTHLGDACSSPNACYSVGSDIDSIECTPDPGTLSPFICRCKHGYLQPKGQFICRKPHVMEPCVESVGCALSNKSPIDTSQVTETCQYGACLCPLSGIQHRLNVMGETYKVCLAKFFGTLKKNGEVCSTSHECADKLCFSCPGQSDTYCVKYLSSASAIDMNTGLLLAVFASCLVKLL